MFEFNGYVLQHPVCTLLGLARAILNLMIEVQASQSKEHAHARTYHIIAAAKAATTSRNVR